MQAEQLEQWLVDLRQRAADLRQGRADPRQVADDLEALAERLTEAAVPRGEADERKPAEQGALRSEARYRLLIEHAPSITYSAALDETSTTLFISPQVERLVGFTAEECRRDRNIWDKQLHPEDRPRVLAEVARTHATGEPFQCEYRMIAKDGHVVWFRDHGLVVHDEAGTPATFEGVMLDITEQKCAEAALHESEERYRRLFANSPNAIMMFDTETRCFIDANPATLRLYGYSHEEFLQLEDDDVTAEPGPSAVTLRKVLAGQLDFIPLRYHRKKDGTVFPVEINACTFRLDGRQVVCPIVRDITDRRKAESAIEQYHERLKSLAFQLVLTEDRERRRLAQELHDGLGQAITLARIKLQMLIGSPESTPAAQALEEIDTLIAEADTSTRSLTFQISPPVLHELGLVPGIEWLAEHLLEQYCLTVRVDDDGQPKPVGEEAALVLFRAVRELVINVARHARTDAAAITIRRADGHLRIAVADRGRGFDPQALTTPASAAGFGLFSVREQIDRLGGHTHVRSTPGAGTTVTLSVPLDPDHDASSGRST